MTNKYIYTIRDINIKDLTREHLATLSIDELIEIIICFKNEFAANENMYDVINQECMNLKNELDESHDDYKHLKDLHNQVLKDLDEMQKKCEKLTNKNNRLTEELNQTKLLLEGKNTQYNIKVEEFNELKRQYKLSCLDCEYKNTKVDVDRYRKAIEEIGGYCNKEREKWCTENCIRSAGFCIERNCYPIRDLTYILDIINKVKEI